MRLNYRHTGLTAAEAATLLVLSLLAAPASATLLPVHNNSFEDGTASWVGPLTSAGDVRRLDGNNVGYLPEGGPDTFSQIISLIPGDGSTQFVYAPNTVYTLTAYSMTGQPAGVTTILDLRGSATSGSVGANVVATGTFFTETSPPGGASNPDYVVGLDNTTLWHKMVVTLDTSLTPSAVGQFISIATTDGGSSPNFDLYSLDATEVPEPASALTAATVLAPLALRRRARRRSA